VTRSLGVVPCRGSIESLEINLAGCRFTIAEEEDSEMPEIAKAAIAITREGLIARALGQPASANPYEPQSKEFILWDDGWRSPEETRSDPPPMDESGLGM
jgi:hypothetical protein